MKSIRYVFLIGTSFFGSCKSADPQANLLIGTWKETAFRLITNNDWQSLYQPRTVNFQGNGAIKSTDSELLSGGWCNTAERYSLKNSRIFFEFGEPKCIPFVNPKIPSEAKIVSLTPQLLILEWGQLVLKFERI